MHDPIDIDHLARLARLSLSEAEGNAIRDELSSIIDMIDEMQQTDTADVEPLANPLDAVQRLRGDAVSETVDREQFLANAPDSEDGYFLVPRVVE